MLHNLIYSLFHLK